jgi:hypothetical protein
MSLSDAAAKRAVAGDPGAPGTAHRLCWLLLGAAEWRLRAIAREEHLTSTLERRMVREISQRGLVRHVLRTYLYDLEYRLLGNRGPMGVAVEQKVRKNRREREAEEQRRERLKRTGVRRSP